MLSKTEKYILVKAIKFAKDELKIESKFNIRMSYDRKGFTTTAYYNRETNEIGVYCKGRAIYDVIRSLAHECKHLRDNELGLIKGGEDDITSDMEHRANIFSGEMVKKFGYLLKDEGIDMWNL